jgi:phage shock protein A
VVEGAMLDTDIEGLSPKDAAAYTLAFITTMKQTERELAKVAEDIALWTRRVELARSRGETSLADQAQARVTELEGRRATLEAERSDLRVKADVLKQKLTRLRLGMTRTVDADLLLAQLQMLTGPKDSLAEAMQKEEAQAKLDELKRKMTGKENGQS